MSSPAPQLRLPFDEIVRELVRVLSTLGFDREGAQTCAQLFAEADRDGVRSHGLARFPRFVDDVRRGTVDPQARAERVGAPGAAWEQWDGRGGPGPLNARAAMARAIELSRVHGLGAVALRHTNHWMRAGNYGWQAAEAGCIGICWTNTLPNVPPWGSAACRVGNNPLVIAVPRTEGPLVLDMSMSQFSYGRMEVAQRRGERLPVVGGFDGKGQLTDDPGAILQSRRPLPIGYWKGAGLSLLLDVLAALLSGGLSTMEIGRDPYETRLSQVFMAFDLARAVSPELRDQRLSDIVDYIRLGLDDVPDPSVLYPGERALAERRRSAEQGVLLDAGIWERVRAM